jgi:hypothetical protein
MRVRILVEGPSEQCLLQQWGRRAFPKHEVIAHPHQGKGEIPRDPTKPPDPKRRGLLDQLPATLKAYAKEAETAVLVLVDADDENCVALKKRLLAMAARVKPIPKRLVFRIAVEETEAFYLGDLAGLKKAFPDADMKKAKSYRPDSNCGTAELFGEIVGDDGRNKVEWAKAMGDTLTTRPQGSRSPSFKALLGAFEKLTAEPNGDIALPRKPRPKKHWKSRHSATRKAAEG